MKSEETGTTCKCKMWREKVRTSRNQLELNHGKDNKIFVKRQKVGLYCSENETEIKGNLGKKSLPFSTVSKGVWQVCVRNGRLTPAICCAPEKNHVQAAKVKEFNTT